MTIAEIIDRYRIFDVEYYHYFTNHLPMTLIALFKMGAKEERLERFASFYIKRLKKIHRTDFVINHENWKEYLGEHKYFCNYTQFLTDEFDRLGKEEFLTYYLSDFIKGVAAGAFHALIKTAYAIIIDDKKEIIDAVSYFAISYLPLIDIDEIDCSYAEPMDILQRIKEDNYFKGQKYTGNNIFEKMKAVSQDSHLKRNIRRIDDKPDIISTIAKTVLNIFLNSGSFTALHTVTATHAFRIVLPYLSDRYKAINYLWIAICAAYITFYTPSYTRENIFDEQGLQWEDILKKASESNNEHVIKLIYSCHEENKVYGDPLYIKAAAKESEFPSV
ncbi:MAG: questin oxidase family protein [Thermodesulfobacteriota bacterium]|nr:questin oxidase family protein [Thermodesulfobacteriota bacterium]